MLLKINIFGIYSKKNLINFTGSSITTKAQSTRDGQRN